MEHITTHQSPHPPGISQTQARRLVPQGPLLPVEAPPVQRSVAPRAWVWVAVCLTLIGCAPIQEVRTAPRQTPPTAVRRQVATDPALERLLRAVLGSDIGHYGVVVRNLRQGSGATVNADRVFYAASLFKLVVMYEAFRQHETGQLSLGTKLTVTAAAAAEDLGTLELLEIGIGDRLTVAELVELMVTASDNTASVLLRNALGRQAIDRGVRVLGLRSTSVASADLPTSAADMATLLEAIATGQAVSEAASREMAQLLRHQRVRDRIPAGLPSDVLVGNKTGNWRTATHDVAIVYAPTGTYVLAVLSDLPHDDGLIARLSRQVYAYYSGTSR